MPFDVVIVIIVVVVAAMGPPLVPLFFTDARRVQLEERSAHEARREKDCRERRLTRRVVGNMGSTSDDLGN